MVFWGKCYHLQQILKSTAEKILILTVPVSDLEEITYTNIICLNIYPCERVKKEKWKFCAALAQVCTQPGAAETLPHNCIQL